VVLRDINKGREVSVKLSV